MVDYQQFHTVLLTMPSKSDGEENKKECGRERQWRAERRQFFRIEKTRGSISTQNHVNRVWWTYQTTKTKRKAERSPEREDRKDWIIADLLSSLFKCKDLWEVLAAPCSRVRTVKDIFRCTKMYHPQTLTKYKYQGVEWKDPWLGVLSFTPALHFNRH